MNAYLLASHVWHHGGGFFPLFPLLFFALWIGVWIFVGRRWHHRDRRSGESVLAERYARGEIDETEYRQRRDVLRGKS